MNCPSPALSQHPAGRRRGVALVITLIMLSVVTITAVAFLALSRRERIAIGAYGEQVDARLLADTALNRAKADVLARMAATTNRLAYGFAVSTNYQNPQFLGNKALGQMKVADFSFHASGNYGDLTNVTYTQTTNSRVFDLDIRSVNGRERYAAVLGNLFYDPRPPVVVQTNANRNLPWEFRFYLDLNRNRRFETNGLVTATDNNGNVVRTTFPDGSVGPLVQYQVGDPEWIGLLEHPDQPHSGTNRFIGRFAYLILPVGRSLDLNYIGNNAKRRTVPDPLPAGLLDSGYSRNQGVGSWELNLAGFLRTLNTNVWRTNDFQYALPRNSASTRLAFSDAERLRLYRQNGAAPLPTAREFFRTELGNPGSTVSDQLGNPDRVDWFSDGPILQSFAQVLQPPMLVTSDDDRVTDPWPGSDEPKQFRDFNQLFETGLALAPRLTGQELLALPINQRRRAHTNSTYNSYTFYRALAQLGTDSPDGRFESGFHQAYGKVYDDDVQLSPPSFFRRPKLNLNYAQDLNGPQPANASVASFVSWRPLQWFTNAVDRLLLSEFTNGLPVVRSPEIARRIQADRDGYSPFGFPIFGRPTKASQLAAYRLFDGSYTNHTYDAQVHRLLQTAANIYEYSHAARSNLIGVADYGGANTRFNFELFAPHVFRPLVYEDYRTPGILRIAGFQEMTTTNSLGLQPWITPEQALIEVAGKSGGRRGGSPEDALALNIYGLPWVVGAKKGLPSFSEAFWQTAVQVTRRLVVTRPTPASTLPVGRLPIGISGFNTLAQYRLNLTNTIGTEAWNSYNFRFPVPVTVTATNQHHFVLYAENDTGPATVVTNQFRSLSGRVTVTSWNPGQFFAPLATNLVHNYVYNPQTRTLLSQNITNAGLVNVTVAAPRLTLAVTNQMVFTMSVPTASGPRIIDVVTLRSVIYETNIFRYLGAQQGTGPIIIPGLGGTASSGTMMPSFWLTNRVGNNSYTLGVSNQLAASLGRFEVPQDLWRDARGAAVRVEDVRLSTNGLNFFLYGTYPAGLNPRDPQVELLRQQYGGLTAQVGFNPSPTIFLTDRRQANDPLVHYTSDDLQPGYMLLTTPAQYSEAEMPEGRVLGNGRIVARNGTLLGSVAPLSFTTNVVANHLGGTVARKRVWGHSPWGTNGYFGTFAPPPLNDPTSTAFDLAFKDPQLTSLDQLRVLSQPTNFTAINPRIEHYPLPNIGWLGRVHRGTPWQTLFLKSRAAPILPMISRYQGAKGWAAWSGNAATHPVADWKFMDLFTTAVNDNAARGLLAVTQTNEAAWSALLSSVPVLDNRTTTTDPQPFILRPDSPEVREILTGYTNATTGLIVPGLLSVVNSTNALGLGFPVQRIAPGGTFTNLGSVLSVPTLSDRAPFLSENVTAAGYTDEVVERLPQQVLSLLRADEPMVAIYAFGQSLKPAPNSFFLRPGPYYGMVTNYAVTGEFVTKSVLRVDGPPNQPSTTVEDYQILYQNP